MFLLIILACVCLKAKKQASGLPAACFRKSKLLFLLLGFETILLVETFNTSISRSELLTSSVEWVTFVTNLYAHLFFNRASFKFITTSTFNSCSFVIRVNSCFHLFHSFRPESFETELSSVLKRIQAHLKYYNRHPVLNQQLLPIITRLFSIRPATFSFHHQGIEKIPGWF
jgi:hypothetical protein